LTARSRSGSRQVSESLAGRASYLTLWPMTRREQAGLGRSGLWEKLLATADAQWLDLLAAQPEAPEDPSPEAGRCRSKPSGLEAYASDLNPVAVLINKAMIEIPPRFAGQPPVNPASRTQDLGGQMHYRELTVWRKAMDLAKEVYRLAPMLPREETYGIRSQLSKSKNTSVAGMVEAGILESKRGKVRRLKPDELPTGWDPATDPRLTAWETVHHLIRALESGGESAAAALLAKLGARAEIARDLCYRLYTLCERKKRAAEALSYNALVRSWPEIARLAREGSDRVEYRPEPAPADLL